MTAHSRFALRRAIIFALIAFAAVVLAYSALPAQAHDMAAWSDPARDEWYRSLKVPGQNVSCCDLRDGAQIDPEKVQQRDGAWYVDLGSGFMAVPPDRVVTTPVSIDGMPYLFMVPVMPGMPARIRCFIPPVGTY